MQFWKRRPTCSADSLVKELDVTSHGGKQFLHRRAAFPSGLENPAVRAVPFRAVPVELDQLLDVKRLEPLILGETDGLHFASVVAEQDHVAPLKNSRLGQVDTRPAVL